jgi:hypothetical protein
MRTVMITAKVTKMTRSQINVALYNTHETLFPCAALMILLIPISASPLGDRQCLQDTLTGKVMTTQVMSQEDGERGHYFGDTNTHSAGTFTSDISRDIDEDTDHDHLDLNQTIVTDISGPGDDVAERANAYERSARQGDTVKLAPTTPQNQPSSASNRPAFTASSRGTASPFDTMTSDFDDDGSLELSQSNDMFGNYAEPPRSARFSGRDEK